MNTCRWRVLLAARLPHACHQYDFGNPSTRSARNDSNSGGLMGAIL